MGGAQEVLDAVVRLEAGAIHVAGLRSIERKSVVGLSWIKTAIEIGQNPLIGDSTLEFATQMSCGDHVFRLKTGQSPVMTIGSSPGNCIPRRSKNRT
jgi:hypothetical protein